LYDSNIQKENRKINTHYSLIIQQRFAKQQQEKARGKKGGKNRLKNHYLSVLKKYPQKETNTHFIPLSLLKNHRLRIFLHRLINIPINE